MPFPTPEKPLPSAAERYGHLLKESDVKILPGSSLEELSLKIDSCFPTTDVVESSPEAFLVDLWGFTDLIAATYTAITSSGNAHDHLTCQEFFMVCMWYFYLRLYEIAEDLGNSTPKADFMHKIGSDLLPAPIWEYLKGLGHVRLKTGKIVFPWFPSDDPGGARPGYSPDPAAFPGIVIDREDAALTSSQLIIAQDFLRNYRHNIPKIQNFLIRGHQAGLKVAFRNYYIFKMPLPAAKRNLNEVLDMFPATTVCFNTAVLTSYRTFVDKTKTQYAYRSYDAIPSKSGSVAQLIHSCRYLKNKVFLYDFYSPFDLTEKDSATAMIFRYRLSHSGSSTFSETAHELCKMVVPPELKFPYGYTIGKTVDCDSMVHDFCSYFMVLKAK